MEKLQFEAINSMKYVYLASVKSIKLDVFYYVNNINVLYITNPKLDLGENSLIMVNKLTLRIFEYKDIDLLLFWNIQITKELILHKGRNFVDIIDKEKNYIKKLKQKFNKTQEIIFQDWGQGRTPHVLTQSQLRKRN